MPVINRLIDSLGGIIQTDFELLLQGFRVFVEFYFLKEKVGEVLFYLGFEVFILGQTPIGTLSCECSQVWIVTRKKQLQKFCKIKGAVFIGVEEGDQVVALGFGHEVRVAEFTEEDKELEGGEEAILVAIESGEGAVGFHVWGLG